MKYLYTSLFVALSAIIFGQVTILEENFDGETLPTGWKVVNNDGHTVDPSVAEYTEAWILKEDPENAGNGTISSTSYFSPINRADRWLITPQLSIGSSGNFISWKGMSHDASFPDSYKVLVSTTGNELADFTDTLIVIAKEAPTWTNRLFELDEYADQDVYIAFVNSTLDGFKLYLDSVYIREHDPLSLEKHELNARIFPNPMENVLHIAVDNYVIEGVNIFNALGQLVLEENVEQVNTTITLNTSGLESGIYFVTVRSEVGEIRRKLVK